MYRKSFFVGRRERDAPPTKPRDIRKTHPGRQGEFSASLRVTFTRWQASRISAALSPIHQLPAPPGAAVTRITQSSNLRSQLPYNASMAQDDFDIDSLAAYLHMMPDAVVKLAERGKLPGRRVAGDWRFSAAEIHHWLENRIGLSDDDALAQMEGALDRASYVSDVEQVSIADLLKPEAIEIPLDARTRGSVVGRMTELAARTNLLWDPAKMAEAVRAREDMHSTALDNGVALLHPRRPMPTILAEALLALGISAGGIPFGSGGQLTDIFFLICSTSDHEHLRILARLSRVINDPNFLASLRVAVDAAAVHRLVKEREATIREA